MRATSKPIKRCLHRFVITTVMVAVPGLASADFLSLAPGDYGVMLLDSSALCAGNCSGTLHIPLTNTNLETDFDWSFVIGGEVFDWTAPGLDTDISPNGLNSCAIEGMAGAICAVNDSGIPITLNTAPFLVLFGIGDSLSYTVRLSETRSSAGAFEVSSTSTVPEPSSAALLLVASAVGLWRNRQRRRRHGTGALRPSHRK